MHAARVSTRELGTGASGWDGCVWQQTPKLYRDRVLELGLTLNIF